jgi:hypothetical protein
MPHTVNSLSIAASCPRLELLRRSIVLSSTFHRASLLWRRRVWAICSSSSCSNSRSRQIGQIAIFWPVMADEFDPSAEKSALAIEENALEGTPSQVPGGGDQRIQFAPSVNHPARKRSPDRKRSLSRGRLSQDEISFSVPSSVKRPQSVVSIPRVLDKDEKERIEIQNEAEKKNVNVDEHLMSHQDVADRYKTKINLGKPGDSLGLTTQQAEQLLVEHGPNILTPPSRRHPFLKYLDCLRSLFNLLLILAGILEYILLGISFKNNFENVSVILLFILSNNPDLSCSIAYLYLDLSRSDSHCGCVH